MFPEFVNSVWHLSRDGEKWQWVAASVHTVTAGDPRSRFNLLLILKLKKDPKEVYLDVLIKCPGFLNHGQNLRLYVLKVFMC